MKPMLLKIGFVMGLSCSTFAWASDPGEIYPEATYNPVRNEFAVAFPSSPLTAPATFDDFKMLLRVFDASGEVAGSTIDLTGPLPTPNYIYYAPGTAIDKVNQRMLVAWQQLGALRLSLVDLMDYRVMVKNFALQTGLAATDYVSVAFSPQRQLYLVIWKVGGTTIRGRYVSVNGAPVGGAFDMVIGRTTTSSIRLRHVASNDSFMIGYEDSSNYYLKYWGGSPLPGSTVAGTSFAAFDTQTDFYFDATPGVSKVMIGTNLSGTLGYASVSPVGAIVNNTTTLSISADSGHLAGTNDAGDRPIFAYRKVDGPQLRFYGLPVDNSGAFDDEVEYLALPSASLVAGFDIAYNERCNRTLLVYALNTGVNHELATEVSGSPCQAEIGANPASLNFGLVSPDNSQPQTTSLKAILGSLTIQSISLVGPNKTAFSLGAHSCLGTLPENQACSLSVNPAPGAAGKLSAVIRVVSDAANQPTLDIPVTMISKVAAIIPMLPANQATGLDPTGVTAVWNGIAVSGLRYRAVVCMSRDFKDCSPQTTVFSGPK